MTEGRKTLFAGLAAALASALCCAGPLIAVTTGVSAAGLARTFGPIRPWLLGATAGVLLLGFRILDREERKACEPGRSCADSGVRRRIRIILWIVTVLAVGFASFPVWQGLVL